MKEGGQIDPPHPSQEKLPSKSPVLLGLMSQQVKMHGTN